MRRRLFSLFAVTALLMGLFVFPAAVEASCSQAYVNVWEDTGLSGDGLHICYGYNIPDLRKIGHTQSGTCHATIKIADDWDNCISSAANYPASIAKCVTFFTGYNYTGSAFILLSGHTADWYLGSTFSDSISSIKWCA
jgi:hypothetical protein